MSPKPKADYQELSQRLDTVLSKLQHPEVQVAEAVELYEQGLKLIKALEERLKETENQITKLKASYGR